MIPVIGIDPGVTGAAALTDGDGWAIFDWTGLEQARDWLENAIAAYPELQICIEKVGEWGSKGWKGTSKLTGNAGAWRGLLCGLKISDRLTEVRPQTWQTIIPIQFRTIKPTKKRNLVAARHLFPTAANAVLTRAKDHNRADAMLIARYHQKQLTRDGRRL